MKKFAVIFISLFLLIIGKAQEAPLEIVQNVDLSKYVGLWYEIASFPQRFQKDCKCTTAEYLQMPDSTIKVINRCTKPDELSQIKGKAFVEPNSGNAKLKVQFFWPFKADYWIVVCNEHSTKHLQLIKT